MGMHMAECRLVSKALVMRTTITTMQTATHFFKAVDSDVEVEGSTADIADEIQVTHMMHEG